MIGKGNFGEVYKAMRQCNQKQFFAVKEFSKKALRSEKKGIDGLYNEIEILRSLEQNQYVINFYEIHETLDKVYIVQEFIEGQELFERYKNKRIKDEPTVKKIMKSLLQSLNYIHQHGLMHRDIKPENIMYISRNLNSHQIKIIDFGLSSFVNVENYLYRRCGTPGFVAPEIITLKQNQKYTEICDVFSVGILFFNLLTGESPFKQGNKSRKKILSLNKYCKINFKCKKLKKYSRKCVDLLKKMCEKSPKRRYTAAEALNHEFFFESESNFCMEQTSQNKNIALFSSQKIGVMHAKSQIFKNSSYHGLKFMEEEEEDTTVDSVSDEQQQQYTSIPNNMKSCFNNYRFGDYQQYQPQRRVYAIELEEENNNPLHVKLVRKVIKENQSKQPPSFSQQKQDMFQMQIMNSLPQQQKPLGNFNQQQHVNNTFWSVLQKESVFQALF